jgi:hypothetical protein
VDGVLLEFSGPLPLLVLKIALLERGIAGFEESFVEASWTPFCYCPGITIEHGLT